MRISKKLVVLALALLMSMSIALVACDGDEEIAGDLETLYNDVVVDYVAANGYALTTDVYLIEDTEKANKVGYFHKTLTVDEWKNATITTVEHRLPVAGESLEPVTNVSEVPSYAGDSLGIDFKASNFAEGYTITAQGDMISIVGSPKDVDIFMDRDMGEVSNMTISITVNTKTGIIENYTIAYDRVTTSTVENYDSN